MTLIRAKAEIFEISPTSLFAGSALVQGKLKNCHAKATPHQSRSDPEVGDMKLICANAVISEVGDMTVIRATTAIFEISPTSLLAGRRLRKQSKGKLRIKTISKDKPFGVLMLC